jgi:hypothetical protein
MANHAAQAALSIAERGEKIAVQENFKRRINGSIA